MKESRFSPKKEPGSAFLPPVFIPAGKDEYWYRDAETELNLDALRPLSAEEIAILKKNDNRAQSWEQVLVSDPFDPTLIYASSFYGLIRLGPLSAGTLLYHDLEVPTGIYNSTIVSSDIGANCSLRELGYLSHYLIGDEVILSHIDEMQCSNHAKFGNGILTPEEKESVRIEIDVMNEAGGRSILPFEDMITADAFLWAAWRDDSLLLKRLKELTQNQYGTLRGRYGAVGKWAVIKSSKIIKDCRIGAAAYIKGANKLKNLSILSSFDEPSQIGEGVELVNGIISYGSRVFYGSKAVRFVLGRNCSLKYGARLIHSVLGDNSTVSCCEMLNNLVFPAHEQHHNNSFLVAALIGGSSNLAAGATIGSNHNSRAPDGELRANRGFWPGLSVTLKHPSRFASYTLLAKGNYPYELDIPFPFSLVSLDSHRGILEIRGAYFWLYNLYALERNAWKVGMRDRRKEKVQIIHSDYLLPDTAEEIISAMELIEEALAQTLGEEKEGVSKDNLKEARALLMADSDPLEEGPLAGKTVALCAVDRGREGACLIKPWQAWRAYREMLEYYIGKSFFAWLAPQSGAKLTKSLKKLVNSDSTCRGSIWYNLGGQIISARRLEQIQKEIKDGTLKDWHQIHAAYHRADTFFVEDIAFHAHALVPFLEERIPAGESWLSQVGSARIAALILRSGDLRLHIAQEVRAARQRDFAEPFRSITFRNREEMEAVLGKIDDNPFIELIEVESKDYMQKIKVMTKNLFL